MCIRLQPSPSPAFAPRAYTRSRISRPTALLVFLCFFVFTPWEKLKDTYKTINPPLSYLASPIDAALLNLVILGGATQRERERRSKRNGVPVQGRLPVGETCMPPKIIVTPLVYLNLYTRAPNVLLAASHSWCKIDRAAHSANACSTYGLSSRYINSICDILCSVNAAEVLHLPLA